MCAGDQELRARLVHVRVSEVPKNDVSFCWSQVTGGPVRGQPAPSGRVPGEKTGVSLVAGPEANASPLSRSN
jgi:hypothetical protein